MAIVTRVGKGSKLTIEEMDNNLLSLETDISSNVSAITSKLDKGSYTGTAKDLENAIIANVTLIASKLDKGSYTGTAKDLENAIIAAVTGASGISIVPTSPAPTGTGIASFTATQAGTYTNYGGVIVAANSFAIISRSASGAFSISQTAFDLSNYLQKSALQYFEYGSVPLTFYQGSWNTLGSKTINSSSNNRVATFPILIKKDSILNLTIPANLKYTIAYFNDDLSLAVLPPAWLTSPTFTLGNTYNYIAIQVSYTNDATITPSNASGLLLSTDSVRYGLNIVQITGTKEDALMSQKAITDKFTEILASIDLNSYLKKNLLQYYDGGNVPLSYVQGNWASVGNSLPTTGTTRICTLPFLIKKDSVLNISLEAGLRYAVVYFNDNLTVAVTAPTWLTSPTFTLGNTYNYIAIQLSYTNGAAINPNTTFTFLINGQIIYNGINILQTTGTKEDALMSQKAITEAISNTTSVISPSIPYAFTNQNPFNKTANLLFKKSVLEKNISSDTQALIVIAGQSNADGRAPKSSAPTWLINNAYTIANFMMWNPTSKSFLPYNLDTNNGSYGDTSSSFSFDIFFAKAYLDANPTKKLYAIKQTVGGVPITELGNNTGNRNFRWQPITSLITAGQLSMASALLVKVKDALDYSLINGIKLQPICTLFHQGESDADRAADGAITAYKQNASNLSSWLRGLFSTPTLPFLNGYIVGTVNSNYVLINNIFNEMNTADEYMKTVDMSSNYTTIDGLHYNAAALEFMGNQMYLNYKSYNL
jgi:hypothetical protein